MKLSDLRKHKKFLIAVVCVLAAIAMGAVFLQPKAEPEDDVIWREYPVKLGWGRRIGGVLIGLDNTRTFERPACGAWLDAGTACGADAPLQVCAGQL